MSTYLLLANRHLKKQLKHLLPLLHIAENAKGDILYYFDMQPIGQYRYLSPVIDHIFGPDTMRQHLNNPNLVFEIVHPDDHGTFIKKTRGEIDYSKPILLRLRHQDGRYIWFEEYVSPVYENGKIVALQGIYRNVEGKIELQQKLEYRATHDRLTDLYNRDYFESQFDYYNLEVDAPVAIAICDLDNVKQINDTQGHKMGDVYIQESARLIKQTVGQQADVARIGGDEFALLFLHLSPGKIEVILNSIYKEVQIYNKSNREFQICMSIGYAYSESSIQQMDPLFMSADNEMYKKKNQKKSSCSGN
ncbi:sensor domain-containing diguanylate cyclase [Lysinibacillus sp. 54212]|uniref:sensor domain-containing diguanylate cyclase n=1 Tax=Lysinibacillus sp. 54212 TaxID=3119829 RepID=UPI002FC666A2